LVLGALLADAERVKVMLNNGVLTWFQNVWMVHLPRCVATSAPEIEMYHATQRPPL
jgi:hypothetical protein